jgi:hypothetical protein
VGFDIFLLPLTSSDRFLNQCSFNPVLTDFENQISQRMIGPQIAGSHLGSSHWARSWRPAFIAFVPPLTNGGSFVGVTVGGNDRIDPLFLCDGTVDRWKVVHSGCAEDSVEIELPVNGLTGNDIIIM